MLLKIAWRNIWRNKRRSFIILSSIIIGTVAILLTDALMIGMLNQILDNRISSYISHIQIHKNGFNDDKIIQNYIPNRRIVEDVLNSSQPVENYCERIISSGLINSASNSSGVNIVGIQPEKEEKVTNCKKFITNGKFLSGKKHEVVISRKLAEKLDVGVGDKIVIMGSALDGKVSSDLFRIVGLYQSYSSEFDKFFIYITLENAQDLLDMDSNICEFAIKVKDVNNIDLLKKKLKENLGESYEILSFMDLLPLILREMDLYKESMYVFYFIIGLALIFSIINIMLISVFERINEFGVLMSIGMKNIKLFIMIIIEAFFLGMLGTLIGLLIDLAIYLPLSHSGLNLSVFAESLASFGSGSIIFPVLTSESLLNAVIIIPAISVLGAIYPAYKTIKLQPVTAIRYI